MFLSLRSIVDEIATGHCTEIDIWDKLVHYFTEYWDGDEHIFQQVLNLSRRQLGEQTQSVTDTAAFFTALENNFSDKNDLLEFLINLTGYLNYHTELGSVNVKQHLKDCRENIRRVKRECIRRGIFRDNNFVGREVQIAKIKDEIEKGNTKGILVCGLGGMGKTCLVNTVCYELRSDKWKTIKFELREQRSYRHFLRTTINKFRELRGSSSGKDSNIVNVEENDVQDEILVEENILQQKLLDYFRKQLGNGDTVSKKQILMFDNIDDVTTNPDEKTKLLAFFKTLLEMMQSRKKCMMRMIITSRDNFLMTTGQDMVHSLVKVEVTRLDREDANNLVRMSTKQSNLEIKQINFIVRVCEACPLALRVICDAINNAPNIDNLIKFLEIRTESLSTSVLSMTDCLNQPFKNLGDHKYTLCKLSLFGTSKFSLRSAAIIDRNEQDIDKRNESESLGDLKITLLLFKSRHLIEIENEVEDENCTEKLQNESEVLIADQEIFSLHPLVYKFLQEKEHESDVAQALEKAKYNYLILFDELVMNIGQEYDINVLTAREKSEKLKVHIAKYIQLMESYENISNLPNMQGLTSTEDTKHRNNVALMILKPEQHLSFIQQMSCKNWSYPLIKVSWEAEYVTAMIRYDQPDINIDNICSDILNTINNICSNDLSDTEKWQLLILHGRMLYNCGRLKMETDSKESEMYFNQAEHIFKHKELRHKQERKKYLADIYNCLGCVYYRLYETEKAINFHKKALDSQNKSHSQNENTLAFLANIGACHFRLGIQHLRDKEKEKCEQEMKKALTFYNDSITVAEALKMDRTDIYLKKLKNRGDVLTMLHQYKEAKKDYQECLDIVKTLYVSPSRKEILSLHAQGDLIRKMIASKTRGSFSSDVMDEERNQEERYSLVDEGLEIYEKLKNMLNSEIFPGDHESFNKIKKNHLYFLKQQHEASKFEDTEKFYSAYLTRGLDDDTDSSMSTKSSSTDSGEGSGDETEPEHNSHSRGSSISPRHSEIEDEGASNEINIHGNIVDQTSWMIKKKQEFKLPLRVPAKRSADEINRSPQKRTCRRASSSSSGVSSMGSCTPDVEKASLGQFRESLQSSHGSSFEDDVFPKTKTENSDRKEAKTDPGWVERRSTLLSFGSGSLEESTVVDEEVVPKKKKRELETTFGTPATFDETLSSAKSLKKQKSEDWMIKEKLSPFFVDRRKDSSSQTDSRNIDNIVDELEDLIHSVQPRMRSLIRDIDSRKARLIDDINGRPTIQYKDEGFFDDTGS
ncbi:uncharacterized protein LOC127725855 isoform X3 [Mytilus californianus]|uniref:uncharacterized protein LOC127725855 isoform X3 n=1 Tax=Mytilus californianus TaxID=6549 RepID=UPI0022458C55|nr:uncharacterized protein LOC127725855 isoform X3 [Mytilus californianus]